MRKSKSTTEARRHGERLELELFPNLHIARSREYPILKLAIYQFIQSTSSPIRLYWRYHGTTARILHLDSMVFVFAVAFAFSQKKFSPCNLRVSVSPWCYFDFVCGSAALRESAANPS